MGRAFLQTIPLNEACVMSVMLTVFASVATILLLVILLKLSVRAPRFFPSLLDKHVVVTGGSVGIGLSLAKRCLLEGAFVTLMARTELNLVKARDSLVQQLGCSKDRILLKTVDVACPSAIKAAIEESFSWRPIDILICNAGIAKGGFFEDVSTQVLESQFRINLLGSIYPVHAALPLMKKRSQKHHTSIVFVNSLCTLFFACGANTYMASKYAQRGLAELLKLQLRPYNINVQLVIPGFTETSMLDEVDKFSSSAPVWRSLLMFKRENAQTTDQVAQIAIEAVKRGNFLTTTGMDGFFLRILGRGLLPEDSLVMGTLELLLVLPARIASFVMLFIFSTAVRRHAMDCKP